MPKLPYIALYTGDWLRDHVAGCSLTAQGLWLRMMIVMHDCERYGYLSLNGSPIPPDAIARKCGCDSLVQYETLLAELDLAGVPSRTDSGVIYSRRMVRDARKRAQNAERQSRCRSHTSVTGNDSDNENEVSAEEVYQAYPLKVGKPAALKAIRAAMLRCDPKELLTRTACFASARGTDLAFVPHPATWFNQERYNDDPATWRSSVNGSRPPTPPPKPKREIPDQMRTWLIEHYSEKREQIQQWQTMDHVPPFLRDEWFRYRKESKTE